MRYALQTITLVTTSSSYALDLIFSEDNGAIGKPVDQEH